MELFLWYKVAFVFILTILLVFNLDKNYVM